MSAVGYVPFNYSGPSALGRLLHDVVRRDIVHGFAIFDVTPSNVFNNPLDYAFSMLFSVGLFAISAFIWYMIASGLGCKKCNLDCCEVKSEEYKRTHRGVFKGYWIAIVTTFAALTIGGMIVQWIYSARLHSQSHDFINSKWNEAVDFTDGAVNNATKLETFLRIDRQLNNESLESTCIPPEPFQLRVDLESDGEALDQMVDLGQTVIEQSQNLNLTQYKTYLDQANSWIELIYPVTMSFPVVWVVILICVSVPLFTNDMKARDGLMDFSSALFMTVFWFSVLPGLVFFAMSIAISDPCFNPYPWIEYGLPSDSTTASTIQQYVYCLTPLDGGPINDNLDTIENELVNVTETAVTLLEFAKSNCSATTLPVTAYVYNARLNDTSEQVIVTRDAVSCVQPHAIMIDTLNRLCHPVLETLFVLGIMMIGVPVLIGFFITIAARPCTTYVKPPKYKQKDFDKKSKTKKRRSKKPKEKEMKRQSAEDGTEYDSLPPEDASDGDENAADDEQENDDADTNSVASASDAGDANLLEDSDGN